INCRCVRHRLEEFLDTFMNKVKPRFEVDYGFALDAESEMAGLNDSRVHGPDGYLVDTFTFDLAERIRSAAINKSGAKNAILQERVIIVGPELVQREPAQVGMTAW